MKVIVLSNCGAGDLRLEASDKPQDVDDKVAKDLIRIGRAQPAPEKATRSAPKTKRVNPEAEVEA